MPWIVFLVLYLKLIIKPKVSKTFLLISFRSFPLHFIYKSIIYSDLIFVKGVRSLCPFCMWKFNHSSSISCKDYHFFFFKKKLSFLICWKSVDFICVYLFWGFWLCSIDLCGCSLDIPHHLDCCTLVTLEIRPRTPNSSPFFVLCWLREHFAFPYKL